MVFLSNYQYIIYKSLDVQMLFVVVGHVRIDVMVEELLFSPLTLKYSLVFGESMELLLRNLVGVVGVQGSSQFVRVKEIE